MYLSRQFFDHLFPLLSVIFPPDNNVGGTVDNVSSTDICNTVECQIKYISEHPAMKYLPAECGIARPQERIINGKEAYLGQFPWMARIGYKRKTVLKFQCGAALVNEWYVVTAAHCLKGHESLVKVIRLGEHKASEDRDCDGDICAPNVQDIEPEEIVIHDKYPLESRFDIAIIKLKKAATYNDFVKPLCLPQGSALTASHLNETTTVAGWGIIDSSTEDKADTLLFVDLPVIDREVCDKIYPPYNLDRSQFCIGVDTGEDSCGGDSGGPVIKTEEGNHNKYYLLGVVSFGKSYCGENPSVYTSVPFFMPWILDNIAELNKDNSTTTTKADEDVANNLPAIFDPVNFIDGLIHYFD